MAILVANEKLTDLLILLESENPDDIPDTSQIVITLDEISVAVGYGGPNVRETMVERGAYHIICKAWSRCCWSGTPDVPSPSTSAVRCRDAVLRALYTLTAGYPELIDDLGWQIIKQAVKYLQLARTVPAETQILVLKLIRNVCVKSEENREHFTWRLGLFELLLELVLHDKPAVEFIREWCATIKAVLLSDDPRFPYNRSAERKRVITESRVLPFLADLLNQEEYQNDEGTLNAIVIVLGTMSVNEDVCLQIESGNVLPGINSIIRNHFTNKTLLRNGISLLRYLAGNALIREKCAGYPFIKWAIETINYYKRDADLVDVTMSCIAFMTLKNACQTVQFLTRNGLPLLQQTMLDYNTDITILKAACFALRNICENTDADGRQQIIQLGYAPVLGQLMTDMPDLKDFYIKPILRELGLSDTLTAPGEEEEEEEEEKLGSKTAVLHGEEFGGEDMYEMLMEMGIEI